MRWDLGLASHFQFTLNTLGKSRIECVHYGSSSLLLLFGKHNWAIKEAPSLPLMKVVMIKSLNHASLTEEHVNNTSVLSWHQLVSHWNYEDLTIKWSNASDTSEQRKIWHTHTDTQVEMGANCSTYVYLSDQLSCACQMLHLNKRISVGFALSLGLSTKW